MALKFIEKGDQIGITAPAGKIKSESLMEAASVLESWGLRVEFGKHIFSQAHGYFSGSDEERLLDFQTMLNDPGLKAIICARGGYGTSRFIDRLDFTNFLKFPKWIVGFSDITSLHLKLHKLGFESIHSVMPIQFPKPEYKRSMDSLHRILFGEVSEIEAKRFDRNRGGTAVGQVIGGNLTLIVESIGTSTEVETKGKILVVEEVGEYIYKVDRMLNQLKRANKLDQLAGLIIGHMTDIKDTDPGFGQTVEEIVLNSVKDYLYPIAFKFPIGHEPHNMAWRHGAIGSLVVSQDHSSLSFSI